MTAQEHYRQAEGCLRSGDLQRAQVHATLAQAAVTAEAVDCWLFFSGPMRRARAGFSMMWAIVDSLRRERDESA